MKVKVIYMPIGHAEMTFEVETASNSHRGIMKEVWRRFNRVDGNPETEDCVKLRVRSLACGDVIEYEGKSFVLLGADDRQVDKAELERIRKMSATSRLFKYSFEVQV